VVKKNSDDKVVKSKKNFVIFNPGALTNITFSKTH
jgi:hypothetical protein